MEPPTAGRWPCRTAVARGLEERGGPRGPGVVGCGSALSFSVGRTNGGERDSSLLDV